MCILVYVYTRICKYFYMYPSKSTSVVWTWIQYCLQLYMQYKHVTLKPSEWLPWLSALFLVHSTSRPISLIYHFYQVTVLRNTQEHSVQQPFVHSLGKNLWLRKLSIITNHPTLCPRIAWYSHCLLSFTSTPDTC